MNHSNGEENSASNARPPQRKRRSDAGEELRLRPVTSSYTGQPNAVAPQPVASMQNPLELRAFGLEDRAEAVISMGETNWSLSNLSQWRQELLHQQPHQPTEAAAPRAQPQQAYIAQRQREYKQQMLRLRHQPPPSQ